MAITYTWEVTGLKKRNEGDNVNAVVKVYWDKRGTDEAGVTGIYSGRTSLTTIPEEGESAAEFIQFGDLTETVVLNWVKAIADDDGSNEHYINSQIKTQIDDTIAAVDAATMPWAPVDEESESPPVDMGE